MRLTFEKTTEHKSEELICKKQLKSKKQITIFIQLSAWGVIRGWAPIKFSPFSEKVKTSLCNKKINKNTDLILHKKIQFCISDTFSFRKLYVKG